MACLFILLIMSFTEQKTLILVKSSLSILYFMDSGCPLLIVLEFKLRALLLARQVLYHSRHAPSPFCLVIFWIRSHSFAQSSLDHVLTMPTILLVKIDSCEHFAWVGLEPLSSQILLPKKLGSQMWATIPSHVFREVSKKSLQNQGHLDFHLGYLLGVLWFLYCTSRPVVYFELIFVKSKISVARFISAFGCSVVPVPFIEMSMLPLFPCHTSVDYFYVDLFLDSLS
jgi:hypothetical protein